MISEELKITGSVNIRVYDRYGALKEEREYKNLVVDAGKAYIASRIKDATATAMSHMAIGTSSTAAAGGQTALVGEVARVALGSTTVTTNSVAYAATFPAGTGTAAIQEAGILNNAAGGTLLCRTVFSVINKGATDSLGITWTVTVN